MTMNRSAVFISLLLSGALVGATAAHAQAPAAPPAYPPTSAAPVERQAPASPPWGQQNGPYPGHGGMDDHRSKHSQMGRGMHEMGGEFRIVPPGMWWRDPYVVQRLSLTPEQTRKMDEIFQQSRLQLIDLKANIERQNTILEPMLDANPIEQGKTLAQIDKVAQARAELEKADAKMLLGIRGVLTPDQWTKLQSRGQGRPSMPPAGATGPGTAGPGARMAPPNGAHAQAEAVPTGPGAPQP